MDREEILLKEYEVCQEDIKSNQSRYWTVVGIFIPVSTALFGWIVQSILSNGVVHLIQNVKCGTFIVSVSSLGMILVFSLGMIAILVFLMRWLKRINSIISIGYFRMREIESRLGMTKNWIVDVLDHHWDKLSTEEQGRLADLRAKHVPPRETGWFTLIIYTLISMWVILVLFIFYLISWQIFGLILRFAWLH